MRQVGFVRAAAALIVVAGALTVGAPARAGVAEQQPDRDEHAVAIAAQRAEELRAFAHDMGMTLDEAQAYVHAGSTAADVEATARSMFPESFAGAWREPMDPSNPVRVAFVGDAGRKAAAVAARLSSARPVTGVSAALTLRQLAELTARVTNDLPAWAAAGIRISQVTEDVPGNRVVITVPDAPAHAAASLIGRYGARAIAVEDAPAVRAAVRSTAADLATCVDRHHCTNVMRGGIHSLANSDGSLYECTTGFTAHKGTELPDHVVTAGHCFAMNSTVTHNGVPIGTVTGRKFSGSIDGENYTIQPAPVWYDMNWVYYNDAIKEYWIEKVAARTAPAEDVGTPVCRSGITTGLRCGTVKSENATIVVSGVTLTGQRIASGCALPGDSGGPIVYSETAYGVVSGSNFVRVNGVASCTSSPIYSFSGLYQTELALNVRVKTS